MWLQDFLNFYPEIELSIIAENTESITDGGNESDNIDINAVIRDGKYAGKSIAYCLASHDYGRGILLRDQALRMHITEQGLNAVDQEKQSVVFWLAQSREGCMVLAADEGRLLELISEDALSAVVATGANIGTSALYWLTATDYGRDLLHQHPSLREKITSQCLNHVIASGNQAGKSVLFWLTRSRKSQRVLAEVCGFIEMISADTLNTVVESGEDAGQSALFWLVATDYGRDLLRQHPSLREKITPQCLNHVIASGNQAGGSVLLWLVSSDWGQSVLTADDGRLIGMISEEALSAVVVSGVNAGKSPLLWLAGTDYGRDILRQHPILREKITPQGLNYVIASGNGAGTSALYWLASTEDGRSMLAANDNLCAKISLTGIKSVHSRANEIKSTLMYLLEDRQTRVIFAKVEQLKRLINEIISQSSEGLNKDMLSILTFAPTLISCIDDRMRFKGLISQYMQDISPEEKTEILSQYAQTNEGKRFLEYFTPYYPKKKMNNFALPECVERKLTQCIKDDQEEESAAIIEDSEHAQSLFQADPITLNIMINPVRLWSTQADYGRRSETDISTRNTTGPFDYKTIYWELLRSGKNPMNQLKILSDNQDPDEVIITADDALMQSNNLLVSPARIKEAIATWLSDRLSDAAPQRISIVSWLIQHISVQPDGDPLESPKVMMLVDILQDENGLGFLMAFKSVIQDKLSLSDFELPLQNLKEGDLEKMLKLYCDPEQSMMLKEDPQATLCDLLASTEAGRALLDHLAPVNTAVADQGLFANAAGGGAVTPSWKT